MSTVVLSGKLCGVLKKFSIGVRKLAHRLCQQIVAPKNLGLVTLVLRCNSAFTLADCMTQIRRLRCVVLRDSASRRLREWHVDSEEAEGIRGVRVLCGLDDGRLQARCH